MVAFKKATKKQAKLRAAFYGPSGSGKTFTALRVATGMSAKVGAIDTERGSMSKYADRFAFEVVDLESHDINAYVEAIAEAAKMGFEVLIIDSLSHAWQELLEEVDRLGASKYKGNKWSAWSEGTPKHKKLVEAILTFPGHVIATMRASTEWTAAEKGKAPQRIGLKPEQGKGIEYEFDLLISLSTEHIGNVEKDRTGKFQDQTIDKPGEAFGKALVGWLNSGEAVLARPTPAQGAEIKSLCKALGVEGSLKDFIESLPTHVNGCALPETEAQAAAVIAELARRVEAKKKEAAGPSSAPSTGTSSTPAGSETSAKASGEGSSATTPTTETATGAAEAPAAAAAE